MNTKTICFVTLGCAKNTVYSEYMMGLIEQSPYTLVENPEDANVIVVNTCGFITAAKEETINTILALNELKEDGKCEKLVAIGCMVQKYAADKPHSSQFPYPHRQIQTTIDPVCPQSPYTEAKLCRPAYYT